MNDKVVIDGKEYTQRSVSNLNMDGVQIDGNIIPQGLNGEDGVMNVTINLAEDEPENTQQLNSQENEDKGNISEIEYNENEDNISEDVQNKETKSWVRKIIASLKKIITKNN
jgi:Mg2+/citrate symporter